MPRLVNFGKEVPLGHQNTEGCKKFHSAFLGQRLTEHDEIGHDKLHLFMCSRSTVLVKVHFFGSTNFQQATADTSNTFCCRVTKFGMVRGLANRHSLPKFDER